MFFLIALMAKYILTLFLLLSSLQMFGQIYEPQILILAPNKTTFDISFKNELRSKNKELNNPEMISQLEAALAASDFTKRPENDQRMVIGLLEFSRSLDFFKQTSIQTQQFLFWTFSERFKNPLINLKNSKSDGSKSELKKISEQEKMQYILNFSSIELFKRNDTSYASISIQLYDNGLDSIVFNKSFIGDWHNPGFTYSCNDHSLECTINNALSRALPQIQYLIAINSQFVKYTRQVQLDRSVILTQQYLHQPFDSQAVLSIFSSKDSLIKSGTLYQVLNSPDSTKFIAFFSEQVSADDFRNLNGDERHNDAARNIDEDSYNSNYPRIYTYIVTGIRYDNQWYYKKSNATYTEALNKAEGEKKYFNYLQNWDFFKEDSSVINHDFWEGTLFEKVQDLKKDKDWERYQSMWKDEEKRNRPYIGFYKMVADELTKEKHDREVVKDTEILLKYIHPFTAHLKSSERYDSVSIYIDPHDYPLVYPPNRSVVLFPIEVSEKNKDLLIRYFVLLEQKDSTYKLYEWSYLKNTKYTDSSLTPYFMRQMNTLTYWNYALDYLDDENFWSEYVFKKSGSTYLYLTEVL